MSYSVRVRPRAERDIAEARAWYEQQRAGLGDAFVRSIERCFLQLELSPEQTSVYYRGF